MSKAGVPHGATYVVCLDCGKQFAYDTKEMRIGKPIDSSNDRGVLHPEVVRTPNRKKIGFALLASLPLAMVVGSALKTKKREPDQAPPPPTRPDS